MAFVEWLHKGRLMRAAAGGKGASLSDLMAAGFHVPPGFCVVSEAYRYYGSETGIDKKIEALVETSYRDDAASVRKAAATISALMAQTPLPAELREQISEAYDELAATSGFACAVRSSATAEDGAAVSLAGLYESYLNVTGVVEVLEAVKRCYASLWSERAIHGRLGSRRDEKNEAMAVVVMALVPCEASGIAFTAHPVTGARDVVVINAGWGLGEAIVSGRVTPDSFVVAKGSFDIEEREIFEKELAIGPTQDGSGTIERRLGPDKANAPALTDDEVREIARVAVRIEAHCGSPQDIEWGIAGGELFILQSRPITTL